MLKTFSEDAVHCPDLAVRVYFDARFSHEPYILGAGKLAALVTVENVRLCLRNLLVHSLKQAKLVLNQID